jgi:glycosyltransferase involved in cell wall biosynthesis
MLSIVVNFYDNRREAGNTLHSLTRAYQNGAEKIEYEVIALDNGSRQPLDAAAVAAFGPEFRHQFVDTASKSPAAAINAAARAARGDRIMVLVDGAHIVSPGVLRLADQAFTLFEAPFIATSSFHLGPERQNSSVLKGYGQAEEDRLLAWSRWRDDGYRLYAITRAFSDHGNGWFGCNFETGCFAMRKRDYLAMGGLDERFVLPGGGLVNLDFHERAVSSEALEYVMLLGEGTFHQFHGGVASNQPVTSHPFPQMHEEYQRLCGKPVSRAMRTPFYMGSVPDPAWFATLASARAGIKFRQDFIPPEPDPFAP